MTAIKFAKAVCIAILRDGKMLTISRRNSVTQWGLVGGKVDPGETLVQAIVRETAEEIGFQMHEEDLIEIYTGICPGDVTYEVTTFFYPHQGPAIACLAPEEGLSVAYQDVDFLNEEVNSPFANYNRAVTEGLYDHYRT